MPSSNNPAGSTSGIRMEHPQWERLIAATPEPHLRQLFAEFADEEQNARKRSRGGRGVGLAPSPDAVPPTTPQEIAAMAGEVPEIEPGANLYALWWIAALHDNADAMRQLAASSNMLIRRSVARARHLPEDIVTSLARDEDRVVRLFLAESCDDAPSEMLLEVWTWWEGSLSFPGRPRSHPNFPRADLLRFADDPNPRMRQLALDDPASGSALVARFSRDEAAQVRRAAAADSRLEPADAARLADDSDHVVRYLARAHPALPTGTLIALLTDESGAKEAARNPAIPISAMHNMITDAVNALSDQS